MKLRNKKTGEIVEFEDITRVYKFIGNKNTYTSLAELNEEWKDVLEEPKEYWCIDWTGGVNHITVLDDTDEYERAKKEIGNYFETKEEAEKAVEKLKAWKRLKDKGFGFTGWKWETQCMDYDFNNDITEKQAEEAAEDIDSLFGGEE